MKRLLWLFPLAVLGGLAYWGYKVKSAPPQVAFTKANRRNLVSSVLTNGKVEPLEWAAVRAGREGAVIRLAVDKGQTVSQGAILVELDATEARNELAAAEARIAQAKAELDVLRSGGRAREIAELNGAIERARVDLVILQRQIDSLARLVEKKAATRRELEDAIERKEKTETEIRTLEKRRSALVSQADYAIAEARLRDAEIAGTAARRRIEMSVIRAPIPGALYQLDIRTGAYLRPGDLIGQIGRLDRVRVQVYVDEPELGSIRKGLPVTITWDALAGKQWAGVVERLPAQIVALNSRQVGEVTCIIENTDRLLIPQTNVNAEIRTSVVENALTIPKEVLRREREETGVFVLHGDAVAWRAIRTGAASITHVEVREGLNGEEQIALPTDLPLKNGMRVRVILKSGS